VENRTKFAAGFEILNLKKSSLQNPVDLAIDYMSNCTFIPVVFPHKL